ncbi:cupin domain-containing protein [Faecalibacter rhinopitheci]|uniref:Cupin n=1 Tax=Faecalibacter rhinopitheci TaxID=2779678 RepID=A0A8J7FNI3_9FLAO|nr:hypothetical protein [Faecalibacter rhinopitheci]MBF0596289.1 hypothetical protein [Faecalibacter rhinopitheci]MBQ0148659.1 hypothetical protein [Candidatus Onthonaster equi]
MLNNIIKQLDTCNKPILHVIFRNNNTRIAALGLRKGQKLIDHQLPVAAKIILLEGKIEIDSKIEIVVLEKFNEYEIPKKVIHQVRTIENALALIVLDF